LCARREAKAADDSVTAEQLMDGILFNVERAGGNASDIRVEPPD
jgi:hypothetical protein